jgi:hypothetical protein
MEGLEVSFFSVVGADLLHTQGDVGCGEASDRRLIARQHGFSLATPN